MARSLGILLRTGAIATLVSAVALVAPAIASGTTVGFDDLPTGTTVSTQYNASAGLSFVTTVPWYDPSDPSTGTADDWTGLQPIVRADSHAQSPPNVGDISGCSGEFCGYRAQTFGKFSTPQQTVTLYIGDFGPSSETMDVILTTYDRTGRELGSAVQGVVGGGGYFDLTNTSAAGDISYFRVRAQTPGHDHIAIDSISFTPAPTPPPPKPAFDLLFSGANPFALGLRPGESLSAPITVLRYEGSTGPLVFDFPGLPPGLVPKITPNPADVPDGGTVTLTVTAAEGATPATGLPLKVRARAVDPATAGTGSATVTVPVTVVGATRLQVSGIEVTQGVQEDLNNLPGAPLVTTVDGGLPEPPSPGAAAAYRGVELVSDRKTIVRVFANTGHGGAKVTGAYVTLSGTGADGKPLPGSPLLPDFSPPSIGGGGQNTSMLERLNPTGAYTFTLPPDWTAKKISLKASVELPGFLGGAGPITSFGSFTLSGISFKSVGTWSIAPLRGTIDGNTVPSPARVFAPAQAMMPFPTVGLLLPSAAKSTVSCPPETGPIGGLRPCTYTEDPDTVPYMGDIGLQDLVAACAAPGKLACLSRKDSTTAALDRLIDHEGDDDYLANSSALLVQGPTPQFGGVTRTDEDTKNLEEYPMSVMTLAEQTSAGKVLNRPLTDVAHELGHDMGLAHAGQGCPGTGPGQDQEGVPWPPDDKGNIQAVGIDPRPTSIPGVYTIFAPTTPDFMSYCAPINSNDPGVWISARYWNALVDRLAANLARDTAGTRAPRVAAGAPQSLVWANVDVATGKVTIDPIRPAVGRVGAPDTEPHGTWQAMVRDAAGHMLASGWLETDAAHVDRDGAVLAERGLVPITAAAAEVQITHDGVVVAQRVRSAHAPTVSILTPRAGQHTGLGATTLVRWRASDPDGDPLDTVVDYSADDGHHWRNIYVGRGADTLRLPSSYFSGSQRARIRVTVNDGFNQTAAVSSRFIAAGRPPGVVIDSPGSGQAFFNDAQLYLAGQGYDDAFRPLHGRALRWTDGRRVLGYGNLLSVSGLSVGRHTLKLRARDRAGRTSTIAVAVRIRQAKPRLLLLLVVPRQLHSGARSIRLRIQTTVPALLLIAGQRFSVDRRLRTLNVRVKRGSGPLRLTLILKAGTKRTTGTLLIARS